MARKETQRAMEQRLVRALKTATMEELVDLKIAGDWDVLGAAFHVLQTRPAEAVAHGTLLANSTDPKRREVACSLMAIGGSDRAIDPVLARLLHDPESSVVDRALSAYGMLQTHRVGREFGRRIRAQQQDPSLTPWPEPLAAEVDLEVLAPFARHPEVWLRMQLGMSLLMCGDERATGLLVKLARDEDEDVRSAAYHSMGWKAYTGGVTPTVVERLWEGTREPRVTPRCDAVCALVRLREPGADGAYVAEVRATVERNAGHGAIYPLVNMLYDPLSSCLPDDRREEACRRWAKSLVGKGPPRRRSATEVTDGGATG